MNPYSLRDRIAELEAEVEFLRGELGFRDDVTADLMIALNMSQRRAMILGALYAARGRWVLGDVLDDLTKHNSLSRRRGSLAVHLHYLRRMFGKDMIPISGWRDSMAIRLLPPAIARIDAALKAPPPPAAP